jgi:TrmH family RNA methyltransferase
MVSRRTLKLIKSLQLKKYRKKYKLFLVEGSKVVLELLESDYKVRTLIGTPVFINSLQDYPKIQQVAEIITTDEETLTAASHFKHNHTVLAVVEIPEATPFVFPDHAYVLALDDVKDPGNLGTILRIADWYGINRIICSAETTDLYNPKVISASMGSFLRVEVFYEDLQAFFEKNSRTVYAACVDEGQSVHQVSFQKSGILLMGSESHGISPGLAAHIDQKINIPRYGQAESLNVSIATAIMCDNIRRTIM